VTPPPAHVAAVRSTELARATPLVHVGQLSIANPAAGLTDPAVVQYLLRDETGAIRPALRDAFPNEDHGVVCRDTERQHEQSRRSASRPTPRSGSTAQNRSPALPLGCHRNRPSFSRTSNNYLQGGPGDARRAGGRGHGADPLLRVPGSRSRLLSLVVVALGASPRSESWDTWGIALSLVTISGFPIIIGLAVDFSIQVQSRFQEEGEHRRRRDPAMARTVAGLGPAWRSRWPRPRPGFVAIQVLPRPDHPRLRRDARHARSCCCSSSSSLNRAPRAPTLREHRRPSAHTNGERRDRARRASGCPRRAAGAGAGHAVGGDRRDRRLRGRWSLQHPDRPPEVGNPRGAASSTTSDALQAGAGSRAWSERWSKHPTSRRPGSSTGCAASGHARSAATRKDLLRATSLPSAVAAVTGGAPVDETQMNLLLEPSRRSRSGPSSSRPITRRPTCWFRCGTSRSTSASSSSPRWTADLHPPSGTHAVFSRAGRGGRRHWVKALEAEPHRADPAVAHWRVNLARTGVSQRVESGVAGWSPSSSRCRRLVPRRVTCSASA